MEQLPDAEAIHDGGDALRDAGAAKARDSDADAHRSCRDARRSYRQTILTTMFPPVTSSIESIATRSGHDCSDDRGKTLLTTVP